MKGRKPQPAHIKLLRGNPGKRRILQEPRPETAAPEPPKELAGAALAEWHRIVPELLKLSLLSKLDRAMLFGYCQAWADTLKPKVRQSDWSRLRSFSAELGLSVVSRARLAVRSESEQKSALKEFIKGKGA